MGEISPLVVLLAVWWLFGLFTSGRRNQQRRQERTRAARHRPAQARLPERRPGGDATQREGSRLEQIMREFEQALEQASRPEMPPGAPAPELPWEPTEGWEADEIEVRSLEEEVVRPEREAVALGGDPEALQQRRVAYAEERNRALTEADHRRFDARIREPLAEPEIPVEAGAGRWRQLRQAIIWREVLGPPVALREGRER